MAALPSAITWLSPGDVIFLSSRTLTDERKHWFVVVNKTPLSDSIVLAAVCTSNIERIRRFSHPETIVEITPEEYSEFDKLTSVDCNDPKLMPLEELVERHKTGEVKICKRIPAEILEKIIKSIKASPRVEERKKDLI